MRNTINKLIKVCKKARVKCLITVIDNCCKELEQLGFLNEIIDIKLSLSEIEENNNG